MNYKLDVWLYCIDNGRNDILSLCHIAFEEMIM